VGPVKSPSSKWRNILASVQAWCTTGSNAAISRHARSTQGLHTRSLLTKPTSKSSGLGFESQTEFIWHPQGALQKVHYENTVAMPNGRCRPSAFGI
jgi:hypothetical protein